MDNIRLILGFLDVHKGLEIGFQCIKLQTEGPIFGRVK